MKYEIEVEQLRDKKLFVGTPMYGGSCMGFYCKATNDLTKLCANYGIDVQYYFLFNESLIQRARNYIVDEFLRSDCSHLMFIDADIHFDPNYVLTLLGLQVTQSEKYDILTAPYPSKVIAWEKVKRAVEQNITTNPQELTYFASDFVFNPVKGKSSFALGEPVEIAEGGTGFMLIPREALEKYAKEYPELSYKPDHVRSKNFNGEREITLFFDCAIDPESRRYLSEDYYFCKQSKKIGINIHMCPWMNLKHIGTHVFEGSMSALSLLSSAEQKPPQKTTKKKRSKTKINL